MIYLQEGPERGVRGIGVTVSLAPDSVVPEESQEGRLVDVAPVRCEPGRGGTA